MQPIANAFKAGRARLPGSLPHERGAEAGGAQDRDFNQLIELGGNIYFLVKLSNTDGWSAQRAVGSMTGMTPDEYAAMMRAGGRPIKANRSIRGDQN